MDKRRNRDIKRRPEDYRLMHLEKQNRALLARIKDLEFNLMQVLGSGYQSWADDKYNSMTK